MNGRTRRPWAGWVGAAVIVWALLAVLARIPAVEAATATSVLFALALPFTYLALVAAVVRASTQPQLTRPRALAITLGVLLALSSLELAAAARLVHWELVFASLRGEQQHFVPDPDLGFRHVANLRFVRPSRSDIEVAWGLPASRSDPITTTYDGRGYRNPQELTRAHIVVIGDSYVEGAYVSDDQIVSRHLQARLRQPVANLGVAGYGTAQELIVLKMDALPLEPRVAIWFFFEGNDLYNDQDFENTLVVSREARARGWVGQHGWWRRSFVRNAPVQLRLMLSSLVPGHCPAFGTLAAGPHRGQKVLFGPEAAFPWTAFEQSRWDTARQTFQDAAWFSREHGIQLLLVYVPIKYRIYRDFIESPPPAELRHWTLWPLPELFAGFCRAEALACLDLTEPLRDAVRSGGMPYARADSHWSAEGHELVAQILEERLQNLGWTR